jgi:hypothetical protein
MLEEMLAYQSRTGGTDSFSDLLAADLDDDARLFYGRMAADIAVIAVGVGRPSHQSRIERMLLVALMAPPSSRAAYWRHLYREISALVAGSDPDTVSEFLRADFIRALRPLRQFLYENADFAGAIATAHLEDTPFGRAVGA